MFAKNRTFREKHISYVKRKLLKTVLNCQMHMITKTLIKWILKKINQKL